MAALLLDPASQYALSLPVTSFCKDVQASPAFSSYIMLQATHFKARDVLGHEFLLLRVSSGTHNFTLRVERRPSAPNYGDKTLPDDRISREPDVLDEDVFRERFHILGHLAGFAIDGPAPGIPLSSVCDILTMMDVEPAWYSLISQQSYWYCSMFLHHVLQRTPGVRVVRVPGPWHTWRRRSKFLKRWVVFTSEDIERDIEGWLREAKLREAERSESPDTLVDAEAWQTDPVFRSYFTEFRRSSSDTDNTDVDDAESFRLQANDAEPLKLQVINDEPLPEKQEVPKATSTENTNTFCDPSILQWVH